MAADERVQMLLVGDIVGTGHPGGLRFFLEKAAPELRQGELVYGNLEFPLTDRGQYDATKYWTPTGRRMNPEDAGALGEAGLHVMSMANNHVMDFGPEGLLHAIELLDSRGIAHCGAGPNLSEARKPAILERKGLRVAFLAYTSVCIPSFRARTDRPGMVVVGVTTAFVPHYRLFEQPGAPPSVLTFTNPEDLEGVRADIRAARAAADVVVVTWHWGVSQGYRKRVQYQTEAGRACIDAGASLVVGHHPHVLQGVEVYRGGAICYSVGNFIFWTGEAPDPKSMDLASVIVDCEIDKAGLRAMSLRSVLINAEGQPEPIHDDRAAHLLDGLEKDSEEFGTSFRHEGDRTVVELTN